MSFDPFRATVFRGGGFAAVPGAEVREVVNPSTLEPVGRIAETPAAAIAAIAAEVAAAQRGWAALDAKSRATALHALANRVETPDPEVARLMTLEMGKPYPEAVGELANVAGAIRYFAEMARDEAGKIAGTTQAGSFQFCEYAPLGVTAHVMPYNFPVLLMMWTVAASLAAGNGCVVKPAEATSLCTLKFMEHVAAALPAGLVACVTGGADAGRALVDCETVRGVAFTGSAAAGRAVAMACARRMVPCVIEAGGSDPMIVSASAPLDVAVPGAVCAAFHLSGQVCTSAERLYVHEAIHDAFVERFAEQTRRLRIGDGLEKSEIGPMVSEAARDKVAGFVDRALAAGASLVTGGRVPPGRNTGWFYEPTILAGVTPEMRLFDDEIFGPVAAITKVASFDEALRLANDSPFGLGASVFTTDLAEAMAAARSLEAGMVWINNPLPDNDALPFGGWKRSGLGRELGRQGLDAFRQTRMVVLDPVPKVQDWWYPYPDEAFYRG